MLIQLKYMWVIVAYFFLSCVPYEYVHHTSLRQLRLGMTTDEVAKVLEGKYVRRGAYMTNQGYADEFWQVRVAEDYASRKPKDKSGDYSEGTSIYSESKWYYWLGFRDGKLTWWGRIGDWGTSQKEEKIQLRVLFEDNDNR